MSDITIVTAYFDIGRGNILDKNFSRSNDTYFEYFSHLAKLENDMVIFTSLEFVEKVKTIRYDKPTKIVVFDFNHKLNYVRKQIARIQQDEQFILKVRADLRNNIEYWSENYVLINNLKTYFVNKAIKENLVKNDLVAWIDFGYVRSLDTLNNIKKWQYEFDGQYVNLFTLYKSKNIQKYEDVMDFIFNNQIFVIGGGIVANQKSWQKFLKLLFSSQKQLLKSNIIDDDQGVYIMCLYKNPKLFKLNYLGKEQWFTLFKKYNKTSKISLTEKIKDILF